MLERFRGFAEQFWTPLARALLKLGISPDLITVLGTMGVTGAALGLLPRGLLWQGALVATIFVVSDMIDGQMARISGAESEFGAFLDSTLDRFGDAAIFGGLVLYFAAQDNTSGYGLALFNLVMGAITSYSRARAEAAGFTAKGGIAERADRLVLVLAATFLAGVTSQIWILQLALWLLAALTTITVGQRIRAVYLQAQGHR